MFLSAALCLLADGFHHFLTIEELEVEEKIKELHSKNEIVEQKNRIIQVNSDVITSLQKEVGSLQVRHFCIVICKKLIPAPLLDINCLLVCVFFVQF